MDGESPLIYNLIGSLIGLVIVLLFLLLPFVLRRFRPESYSGLWKTIGDVFVSPLRVFQSVLGLLTGNIIVFLVMSQNKLSPSTINSGLMMLLFLFVCFISIVYGLRLRRIERRLTDIENPDKEQLDEEHL